MLFNNTDFSYFHSMVRRLGRNIIDNFYALYCLQSLRNFQAPRGIFAQSAVIPGTVDRPYRHHVVIGPLVLFHPDGFMSKALRSTAILSAGSFLPDYRTASLSSWSLPLASLCPTARPAREGLAPYLMLRIPRPILPPSPVLVAS